MAQTISPAGVALVRKFEGCARKRPDGQFAAYPDPGTGAEPWTIGWGSTGAGIGQGTVWTQAQCDARLQRDLQALATALNGLLAGTTTSQPQFDAMADFAYNLGVGALRGSTLLAMHRAGNHAGAKAEFGKWTHAAGRVLPGLVQRRAAEAALYGEAR